MLAQIQDMEAVDKNATEHDTTPYVFAKAFFYPAEKRISYKLCATIKSLVSSVNIAIMAIGPSAPANLWGVKYEVRCITSIGAHLCTHDGLVRLQCFTNCR